MHVRSARGDDAQAPAGILNAIISEGGKSAISRGASRWDREGILGIDRDFEGVLLLCSLNRPFAVLSLEGTSPSSIANVCSSQHPSAAFDPEQTYADLSSTPQSGRRPTKH
jgi:hypothetical protein